VSSPKPPTSTAGLHRWIRVRRSSPEARHLRSVRPLSALSAANVLLLPETPLSESALLVNAADGPSLGHEIARDLATADPLDLLCALLKWSGLRFVLEELRDLIARSRERGVAPPALWVLTTTYIGASDARAIEELAIRAR